MEASAGLPAISTVKVQLSLPCLLEATNIISPASTLLTLKSFSVCWSSSGIDISQTPGLPASSAPLLGNRAKRHILSVLEERSISDDPRFQILEWAGSVLVSALTKLTSLADVQLFHAESGQRDR